MRLKGRKALECLCNLSQACIELPPLQKQTFGRA